MDGNNDSITTPVFVDSVAFLLTIKVKVESFNNLNKFLGVDTGQIAECIPILQPSP